MHPDLIILPIKCTTSRSGAVVARWAHNPKVVCSNQASATLPKGLERKNIFRDLFVLRSFPPFFATLSFSPKIHAEHFKKSSRAFSKKVPMIFQKGAELFFASPHPFQTTHPSPFSKVGETQNFTHCFPSVPSGSVTTKSELSVC